MAVGGGGDLAHQRQRLDGGGQHQILSRLEVEAHLDGDIGKAGKQDGIEGGGGHGGSFNAAARDSGGP
ncbi:hypothetical protein [Mangrovicoccus ximenensis]|uniref:hypothetical protein n=1 Tax=Mangrovicoccus ximenensis TaxID=1911570 RepID=UPI001F1F272E|nr:hypothetical protein [Mangrovicoccus ximenensis]